MSTAGLLAMDGVSVADLPWTITRLELVYYSRRYKRWQIWQEATKSASKIEARGSASGELYRAQIFSLLETVRESLIEVQGAAGFELPTAPELEKFTIGTGGLQDVLIKSGTFWPGYLQYIRGTAEHFGIPPSGDLGTFLSKDRLKRLVPGEIDITREVALDLISMLPVLRHWDLQGCWVRALSGSANNQTCWSPTGKAPFYMAALTDSTEMEPGPLLVEKPQKVELKYQDLAALDSDVCPWNPQHFRPENFFRCCYKPESGDELSLYQCYAFLFDKLLKMLNPTGGFFIAYPIEVLGRIHFLQLWLNAAAGKTLADLWQFWFEDSGGRPSVSSPHSVVWPHLREFLSTNLQGINQATFQADWQKQIATQADRQQQGGTPLERHRLEPKTIEFSLCKSANLLMPLDWIKWTKTPSVGETEQHALWAYQRYDCADHEPLPGQKKEPWGDASPPHIAVGTSTGSLGARWQCIPSGKEPDPQDCQEIGSVPGRDCTITYAIRTPRSSSGDHCLRPAAKPTKAIVLGAVRLALEQQLALGEMFRKQQEDAQREIDSWVMSKLLPFCAVPENMVSYKNKGIDSLGSICTTDGISNIYLSSRVQERFGKTLTLARLAQYLGAEQIDMLMNQKIPFHMSLYLEVGPIAALTHLDEEHWNEGTRKLGTALSDLSAPQFPSDVHEWQQDAIALHEKATNQETRSRIVGGMWGRTQADDVYLRELTKLHDRVRCEHRQDDLGPFKGIKGIKIEQLKAGSQPIRRFRPCAPIIAELGDRFRDLALQFDADKTGTVYTGAFCGKELLQLPNPGYEHTKPLLFKNVFAFKYAVNGVANLRIVAKANEIQHLGSACQKYGKLLVGAQVNTKTKVQEVGSDYHPLTLEKMFGETIPALHCKENQIFIAFLVETARLR